MKTKLLFSALVAATLFACSSEENANSADDSQFARRERNELSSLQNRTLREITQQFSFTAGEGEMVSLKSKNGVNLKIDPGKVTVGGKPYSGKVNVEYVEIFGIADMITTNKTTMGIMSDEEVEASGGSGESADAAAAAADDATPPADEQPAEGATLGRLMSGGEFFVNMTTEEGENVDNGTPFTLEVPTELTGEPDEEMLVWKGEETPDGDVVWKKETEPDGSDKEAPIDNGNYIMDLLNFGWSNIDKLAMEPGPKTTMFVEVPAGYDNTNTKVYLAYQGVMNSIAPMYSYDPVTGYFGEPYNLLPIGQPAYFIVVSSQSGQWIYGYKAATITVNGIVTFTPGDLSIATTPALISALSALP